MSDDNPPIPFNRKAVERVTGHYAGMDMMREEYEARLTALKAENATLRARLEKAEAVCKAAEQIGCLCSPDAKRAAECWGLTNALAAWRSTVPEERPDGD